MKRIGFFLLAGALGLILVGCGKSKTAGESNTQIRLPTPTPTPDRRQLFKGMYVVVSGVYRKDEVKDTFGPDPTKIIKPKNPENDFAEAEIELRTVNEVDFDWESKWDGSGTEVSTPEGKVLLRGPYRATDSLGNRLTPIQSTVFGQPGSARFIKLYAVYELPRTATIATVQFEGLTLNAVIPHR